jgi:hypothetical protein
MSDYRGFGLVIGFTWSDNKFRELIAVKVLLLNIIVVAFKVLPLGSYAPMPASSPPFETILELVLWNGLHSCRRITPGVNQCHQNAFLSIFPLTSGTEKVTGGQIR